MQTLQLYSTPGCHLCELAKEQVEMCIDDSDFYLSEVDISADENLVRLYGTKVPVLALSGFGEQLYWPFDRLDVERYLASASPSSE